MKNPILNQGRFYALLAVVVVFAATIGLLFYGRNFNGLNVQALDCAQIARNITGGNGFSTSVIPTQITESFPELAKRAAVPDLTQAPLYPVLLGAVFGFAGESDRVLGMVTLALFVFSAALLFILVKRLSENLLLATLCALVFSVSFPVLSAAASGQPQSLACLLLLFLLLTLTPAPEKALASGKQGVRRSFVAGLLLALCYLNDYASLCYALPIALMWRRDPAPWKRPAVLAFLCGFILFAAPWWIRNFRLTGDPFYSIQWSLWAAQAGNLHGLIALFRSSLGSFFYGAATVPHLYLMPFVLVSPWLSSASDFKSRCKTATLTALVLALVIFSLLGRSTAQELVPLAPLLTILGLTSFLQIVGSKQRFVAGSTPTLSPSVVVFSKMLKLMGMGISGQTMLERARYDALEEQAAGDAYLYKGRWLMRRVRQARALAVLLLLMLLPWLFLPPRPAPDTTKAILSPLAKVVKSDHMLVTNAPEQVAWYINRKTLPLPQLVDTLIDSPKTLAVPNVAGIYLSDQMRSYVEAEQGTRWLQIYARQPDLPGYQRVTPPGSRSVLYLKQPSIAEARQLVKSTPKSADAYITLGNALVQQRQFKDAQAAFTSAVQLQPRSGEALVGTAMVALAQGDATTATQQFNKALAIAPRATPALMGLAQAAAASGKKDVAISLYERVLSDSPDNPIALNNLAQYYSDENKDLYRALEMARRAAAHNPGNKSILDTLASVCDRLGYKDDAAKIRQQIAKIKPN